MCDDISTYLGPKGYTIYKDALTVKEQELIRKELTVSPFVPKNSMVPPTSFPVYRESKNKFYLPRFYGMENYGEPDDIKIGDGKDIDLEFKGSLRDFQKPIVETYVKSAKKGNCGLLAIHTGAGKTVMALNIISRIKKKTLIIVHKEFLLRQWIERIEQFLPDAKVGKIQANILDIEGKDIVIAMLQSLSMKSYPAEVFEDFGLTIVDEVHRIGAEVFSRSLFKAVTKYMLGVSATVNRKDGLTKVIKMFIGDVIYKKERKGENKVLVKGINYEVDDDGFNEIEYNYRGQVHYTKMIKKLCEYNRRSEFILEVLKDQLKEKTEQQIMILGHNKNLLKYLFDAIHHRNIASVGYYVGGMKEKDLKISESKKVIIGTYAMAEEGLDIKTLTTLLMATPRVDVTQAVGRILRKKDHEAVVIDIIDSHAIFQRHWDKRRRFYQKQKFNIKITNTKNYKNNIWNNLFKDGKKVKAKAPKIKSDLVLTGKCLILE
tara:strand:+ start:3706 stop:5172 length:1467 start_codon:yes stop_codon:yes gene_type:complete